MRPPVTCVPPPPLTRPNTEELPLCVKPLATGVCGGQKSNALTTTEKTKPTTTRAAECSLSGVGQLKKGVFEKAMALETDFFYYFFLLLLFFVSNVLETIRNCKCVACFLSVTVKKGIFKKGNYSDGRYLFSFSNCLSRIWVPVY